MNFVIDLTFLEQFINQSPWEVFWFIFSKGGWVVFFLLLLWLSFQFFVIYKQNKYAASLNYILLAIDIPRENVQSPKAVEQIFVHLSGIQSTRNWVEKNLKGSFQESFSLEIISLEGYIQFLIRAPDYFRDVVEAAIYSQYPEAEIVEVADYILNVPKELPNEEYDLWGTELKLVNEEFYPLRTYPAFEHPLSQEFKDPLGPLLEAMSKLQKGEQLWIQYLITPITSDWTKGGGKKIKELLAMKEEAPKETLISSLAKLPAGAIGETTEILASGLGTTLEGIQKKETVEKGMSTLPFPPPKEKGAAEAIHSKISKIGFETKLRMIYLARREIFSMGRGVSGFFGGIKQFNSLDLNAFKPASDITTSGSILWGLINWKRKKLWRQKKILRAYRNRSTSIGVKPFVLNIEELASLWHFPTETVKAPLIKKISAKRAEPPFALPIEKEEAEEKIEIIAEKQPISSKGEPPKNLPVV